MIDKHDTISLFANDRLRASCFVDYFWKIIEEKIIYVLGMTDYSTISIYVDSDSIIFSSTSNFDMICTERYSFYFNHVLTLMTDLCISMTINMITSDIKKVKYDMCSFYYETENREDDGVVEIYCDAYYNISTYEDFKIEMTSQLSKELQYLIHRNILNNDINSCNIAKIDAEYEEVNMYSKIKNIDFLKSAKLLYEKEQISREDYLKILGIKKEIENEFKRQREEHK